VWFAPAQPSTTPPPITRSRSRSRVGADHGARIALGFGVPPVLSPDGKWIVYGTRYINETRCGFAI
jgi:hypothetical protein